MIKREVFGELDGETVYKYTIKDQITVSLLNLGARIYSIEVKDKAGKTVDVNLNMKTPEDIYLKSHYMGATVGRCANRMSGDGFTLNGVFYPFLYKKGGKCHSHGGKIGFDKKIFVVQTSEEKNSVSMTYHSPDGEEGYPGNLDLKVVFTVTGDKLSIEYFARSDKDTLFNPTNHAYFNLNGEGRGDIENHLLYLDADGYLETDENQIPTGKITDVSGTPFDFRSEKPIGKDIEAEDRELKIAGGFDHNFCINAAARGDKTDKPFAKVFSPDTGIEMDCFTDMPGVQFYAGNSLKGDEGKSFYGKRAGLCLETQFFPDAVNHPEWESPVLKAEKDFYSKTEYLFKIRK